MRSKKFYARQYEAVPVKAGRQTKHEFIYKGPYYRFDADLQTYKKLRAVYCMAGFLLLALFVCMGLAGNAGMRALYVALPCLGMFMPILIMSADGLGLMYQKRRLTQRQRDVIARRYPLCAMAVIILGAIACIGDIVFLCTRGFGTYIFSEGFFLAFAIILTACAAIIYKLQNGFRHKLVEIPVKFANDIAAAKRAG